MSTKKQQQILHRRNQAVLYVQKFFKSINVDLSSNMSVITIEQLLAYDFTETVPDLNMHLGYSGGELITDNISRFKFQMIMILKKMTELVGFNVSQCINTETRVVYAYRIVKKLSDEQDEAKTNPEHTIQQLTQQNQVLHEALSSLTESSAAEQQKLQHELAAITEEKHNMQNRLEELNTVMNQLKREHSDLRKVIPDNAAYCQDSCGQLQSVINKLSDKCKKTESDYNKRLTIMQSKYNELESERNVDKNEIEQLTSTNTSLNKNIAKLQQQIVETNKRNEKNSAVFDKVKHDNTSLKTEVSLQQERVESLKKQIKSILDAKTASIPTGRIRNIMDDVQQHIETFSNHLL